MKKQLLLLLAGCLVLIHTLQAQNKDLPNAIHAKLNFFDYGALYDGNFNPGQGFELGYFRNVSPLLNVGIPFKLGLAKLPETNGNTLTAGLDLRVQIQNSNSQSLVVPYAFAGAGIHTDKYVNGHLQIPGGAGINIRINPYAFINIQAEYRLALADNRDHVQLGAGFVYLLHKTEPKPEIELLPEGPPDFDRDSIPDVLDKCPEIPGTAAALGCPDADGDSIADDDDQCPDQPGSIETNGCPDTDGDGFADKDDECPETPGTVKGCPDADFDGFADKDDECPDQPGRWNGCPDSDYDGVADKDDKCPNDPGPASNQGCPQMAVDSDKDGIPDQEDKCPDQPGTIAYDGCPPPVDTDKDGVPDNEDPCPDKPGSLRGCPDADGDGIADKDDKCPYEFGDPDNAGCPKSTDTDADGFADQNDECPDVPGSLRGCPDADGDGIADKDDKCPYQAGSPANNGCPAETVADKDKDGVPDASDPCPDKAGNFNGCPDSDGDGVPDNLDKCPNTPGETSNNGCPEIRKETKERLEFAMDAIQFETGKAVLLLPSYNILDEIVGIMRQYPDYNLIISGHTDNVGSSDANLQLSRERAKVCYEYLQFRGIKENKMRHAGFGEMRPIADNNTPEGREKNRRVEFELTLD